MGQVPKCQRPPGGARWALEGKLVAKLDAKFSTLWKLEKGEERMELGNIARWVYVPEPLLGLGI